MPCRALSLIPLVPCLLLLACSGSAGSSLSSSSSLVGTWKNIDGSLLYFESNGQCLADIMTPSGTSLLCGDCTYATSGQSLALVVHTSLDGGPTQDLKCACSFEVSDGTLQVTSPSGSSCPAFSATLQQQSGSSFFSSGCGS